MTWWRPSRPTSAATGAALALLACWPSPSPGDRPGDAGASAVLSGSSLPPASAPPPASASASASAGASTSASASASAGWPGRQDGCPEGMVRVEGDYCPAVVQDCVEFHKEYAANKEDRNVSERCLRYASPSRCVSERRVRLSFCMDRFEYPNQPGELPRVLVQWTEAVKRCQAQGKRLCTEDEFNFACEGPEMRPYVGGYVRDREVCNIDRSYQLPDHKRRMRTYDRCLASDRCRAELERLDGRHRIGERLTCLAWSGVYDLNGNVNEWVNLPGKKRPDRSGLKGGWWGPVRSRCRPTVTFHKEEDFGYEAGFRCCRDASP